MEDRAGIHEGTDHGAVPQQDVLRPARLWRRRGSGVYFNKSLADINEAEAATLAGVLPAPSRYNPVYSTANAKMRRGYVLGRMRRPGLHRQGRITTRRWRADGVALHGAAVELNAPYVAEMVRSEMLDATARATYTDGYQVVTSLDSRLQAGRQLRSAQRTARVHAPTRLSRPLDRLEPDEELLAHIFEEWPIEMRQVLDQYAPGGLSVAIVTAVNDNNSATFCCAAARRLASVGRHQLGRPNIDRETTGPAPETAADVMAVGDVIHVMPTTAGTWALAQEPEAQGAVVSIDPYDGAVNALTGGFDFTTSKFNRARQAFRQPGSSFKPFIYSAALEHGNTPATVVLDAPVVINSSELESVWRPINYSGRFYGPTRMREALVRSMNLVSVRLLLFETGIGNAVRHIEKFGFGGAALPRNGSLALGGGAGIAARHGAGLRDARERRPRRKALRDRCDLRARRRNALPRRACFVCDTCVPEEEPTFTVFDDDPEQEMTLDEMADSRLSTSPTRRSNRSCSKASTSHRRPSPQNAFLVQDMMRDVIMRGTGRKRAGSRSTRPVGQDRHIERSSRRLVRRLQRRRRELSSGSATTTIKPLGPGEEGSRTALPIWIEFARIALAGVPENQMPMPEGPRLGTHRPVVGMPRPLRPAQCDLRGIP